MFSKVGAITGAIMEAVVLVIVIIMVNTYVIGNQSILNTSVAGSIAATVVPILQAGLLIAAILGAIGIIYFAATHTFKTGK